MFKTISILFFLLFSLTLYADNYLYWIQLNTKTDTPYSLSQPEYYLSERALERRARHGIEPDSTDLPVNPLFTDSLKQLGFEIKHTSRWMNGAIAYLPSEIDIDSVFKPSFVDKYELRKGSILKSTSEKFSAPDTLIDQTYGQAFRQIEMLNGQVVHEYSRGKGVHVAIIDAGFSNVNVLPAFDSLFTYDRILGTFDFVNPLGDVYKEHAHGTMVLSVLAANLPGQMLGVAPDASYWLLRSEDARTEWPIEEDYWIIAAEFADSAGCDVINTSLGYSTFDNPEFNHPYDLYDGNTLRISRAANKAVDKGMIVVCSAGNSGNSAWRHIVAPSEAEKVLCVAAVNANGYISSFSSRGFSEPDALPKPDLAAMGQEVTIVTQTGNIAKSNGTSFSSPLIAGMAACMAGIFPEKPGAEIMHIIRQIGNSFPAHSSEYGYGIPNFISLPEIIKNHTGDPNSSNNFICHDSNFSVYPNPFTTSLIVNSANNNSTFYIRKLNGNTIYSQELKASKTEIMLPQISVMPAGFYIATIHSDKEIHSFKLIKL